MHLGVVPEVQVWGCVQHKNRNPAVERWVTLFFRPLGWRPDLPCCISQCVQTCASLEITPIPSVLNRLFVEITNYCKVCIVLH